MSDLYAWVVKEEDGKEGPVCAILPGMGMAAVPLVSMNKDVVCRLAHIARRHGDVSGKPVRLVRFAEVETLERW
jgi:hypothetical protein